MHILLCVFLFVVAEAQKAGKSTIDDNFDAVGKQIFVNPDMYKEPVPFGHIARDGFGDPFSPARQPIDNVDLDMRRPKNRQEAIELLKLDKSKILFLNPNLLKLYSNRGEEILGERMVKSTPETNLTGLKWTDLSSLQIKDAMMSAKKLPERKTTSANASPSPYTGEKASFFADHSFDFSWDHPKPQNWTTCDQFAVKAIFSSKDIVNVKWTPFYLWTDMRIDVSVEHTFEYPTEKVVLEYRSKYGNYIKKNIDWTQPKLLMKGPCEMLLISAGKRGLFDAITKHDIPESLKDQPLQLPSLSLRIKIEDPYLVLSHCEDHYATLMAISGNEPTTAEEMEAEAATIKFTGTGRPIWRNFKAEREKTLFIQESKRKQDNENFITLDIPMPNIGAPWETEK